MLSLIGSTTGLKWLYAFEKEDAPFFPYRSSIDTGNVIQDLLEKDLVVLFGDTGCGKTSYIQAQLIPALELAGIRVTMVRSICDPFDEIIADLHQIPVDKLTSEHKKQELDPLISQMFHQSNREWVLIIDPCENLLFFKGPQVARKLFANLSRIYRHQEETGRINLHILISLRADFLPDLEQYQSVFPILKNAPKYHLEDLQPLEIDSFLQIFSRLTNIHVSQDLKNYLVNSVGKLALRTVDIQLIICFIYQEILTLHGSAIGSNFLELGLDEFHRISNIPNIIRNFINSEFEKTVTSLKNSKAYQRQIGYHPHNRSLAYRFDALLRRCIRLVFISFISSRKMAVPVSMRAIIYQVFKDQSGIPKKWIAQTVVALVHQGLIRRTNVDPNLLELASPSLAVPVSQWIDSSMDIQYMMDASYKIRHILAESITYRRLLSTKELDEIGGKAERTGFSTQELRLIFQSSLANAHQTLYWYDRMKNENVTYLDIIRIEKTRTDFKDRVKVVKGLYRIGDVMVGELVSFLQDEYPQVRAHAVGALEELDKSGEWRQHLSHEAYIPPGPFPMGTNRGNFADEGPQHFLDLEAYYISLTPVTHADYKRYMDDIEEPYDITPGMERHPITNLTWYQIQEYARWASLRLPNEPEWEKAASWNPNEMLKRLYPWGNQFDETLCNMRAEKLNTTTPVGRYTRLVDPLLGEARSGDSFYGCKDMAGNVWEWTNSIFMPYPYNQLDGREDKSESGSRVIRGGSFECGATYVTCTVRLAFDPYSMRPDLGFRTVLKVPDLGE